MEQDFFSRQGKVALGSKLRQVTDLITKDASKIYDLFGVSFKPKWYPVFEEINYRDQTTASVIAKSIGQSKVSVGQIVKELVSANLIEEIKNDDDARVRILKLSALGIEVQNKISKIIDCVSDAVNDVSSDSQYDLWEALNHFEKALNQNSLFERVKKIKFDKDL